MSVTDRRPTIRQSSSQCIGAGWSRAPAPPLSARGGSVERLDVTSDGLGSIIAIVASQAVRVENRTPISLHHPASSFAETHIMAAPIGRTVSGLPGPASPGPAGTRLPPGRLQRGAGGPHDRVLRGGRFGRLSAWRPGRLRRGQGRRRTQEGLPARCGCARHEHAAVVAGGTATDLHDGPCRRRRCGRSGLGRRRHSGACSATGPSPTRRASSSSRCPSSIPAGCGTRPTARLR